MTWEPMTVETISADGQPPILALPAYFPIEFDHPSHAWLTWERDAEHMPVALTPLAGDYARVVGGSLNGWYGRFPELPQRWHTGVWHGYVYYAFEPNATAEEWTGIRQRVTEICRDRAEVTDVYWRDTVLPELRTLYPRMDAVDTNGPGHAVADAWEAAWLGAERAWQLHDCLLGPYQILVDLAEAYGTAMPDAPACEVYRLIQGSENELYETELETERLAARAAVTPAVASALRTGLRSVDGLRAVTGGRSFVEELATFLAKHGHLGQTADDLSQPSWGEEPALFLAELAKRIESPPASAADRRARLERDAAQLAEEVRTRLSDRPDDLKRFDTLLELARRIGPLTERHNYWIDRAAQAHLRVLSMRVGDRLVGLNVIRDSADIMYLRRHEVSDLLRDPTDHRREVVDRRRQHARQKGLSAPSVIGGSDGETPIDSGRQPSTVLVDEAVLRGTGASPGVVRGTARVVLSSSEFERVGPGDIIVCDVSNPSWVVLFAIAGGLVTNIGGLLSHAAIVAREFGLPAVVGVRDATTAIHDGRRLEIDGTAGTVRLL